MSQSFQYKKLSQNISEENENSNDNLGLINDLEVS